MAAELKITIDDSGHSPGTGSAPAPAPGGVGGPVPVPTPVPTPSGPTPTPTPTPKPTPTPVPTGAGAGPGPLLPKTASAVPGRPQEVYIVGPFPLAVHDFEAARNPAAGPRPAAASGPGRPDAAWVKLLADRLASGAAGLGRAAVGAANNSAVPAAIETLGAVSKGLARLGPAGLAASAAVDAAGAAIIGFTATIKAFTARGRELAGINGQLSGAVAYADVRSYQQDIKEADRLGPQLAKLIENQAKAEATFREIMLPLKEFVIRELNQILSLTNRGFEALAIILENSQKIADMFNMFGMFGGPMVGLAVKAWGADLAALAKEIRDILKGGAGADPIDQWIRDINEFVGPGPVGVGRRLGRLVPPLGP